MLFFFHRLEYSGARRNEDTCSDMSIGWGGEVEEIGISHMHACLERFAPEVVFAPAGISVGPERSLLWLGLHREIIASSLTVSL